MNKIALMGDSLTFGYGVQNNKSFASLLQEEFTEIEILNCGVCGSTTTDMMIRFTENVIRKSPSLIILLGGSNDLLCNRPFSRIIENFELMLKDAILNNINVVLLSPPPIINELAKEHWDSSCDYSHINSLLSKLQKYLYSLSNKYKIPFINLWDNFENYNEKDLLYTDGLHLSVLGNKVVFNLIRDYIKSI